MFSSCGNRTINVIYDILPSFNNVMFTLAIYYNRTIRIVDSFSVVVVVIEGASERAAAGVVLFPCPFAEKRSAALLPPRTSSALASSVR